MQPEPRPLSRFDEDDLLEQLEWLRGLARSLVSDPSTADDLVHDAWLKARRGIPAQLATRSELRRWLAAVARNLARTRGARESRRTDVETRAQADRANSPGSDELVERANLQAELARELLRLEPDLRDAVLLRYMEGLGSDEMGRRLSITPEAARKRVERGLRALRARLEARHQHERDQWLAALVVFGADAAPLSPNSNATPSPWIGPAWLASAVLATVVIGGVALVPWGAAPAPQPVTSQAAAQSTSAQLLESPDAGDSTRQAGLTATTTSFQLREASGEPASGYSVLRHSGERFEEVLLSDAEGRVAWSANAETQALLVWRHDYALNRLDPPAPDARQVVVLPEGATLAGVVAGIQPGRTCHVLLTHDKPSSRIDELGRAGALASNFAALESTPPGAAGQMLALGEDGSFRLRGLPRDWSGALELRMPYVWTARPSHGTLGSDAHTMSIGGPAHLQLRTPTTRLQASVASLPCVRGLLVEGPEQRPLARATLEIEWCCAYSSGQFPIPVETDGVFWLPLTPALARCGQSGAQLVLSARAWSHELDAGGLVEGGDLGVLVVPPVESWPILVLDHQGRPLSGARVMALGPAGQVLSSHHSDPDGNVEVFVPAGVERLVRIAHAGHKPRYLRTGPGAATSAPLLARLERAAELQVRAIDASGRELQGALRVRAPMAAEPSLGWRDLLGLEGEELEAELRWIAIEEMASGIVAHLGPDKRGARIGNVARGTPLVVEWLDHEGMTQASATTIVPPGEWTSMVEIAWNGNGLRVRGNIRDQQGAPVANAMVELGRGREEFNAAVLTGDDGSFEFPALRAPLAGLCLCVSKLGHAPIQTPPRDFGPGDEVFDLVLAPSRPLALRLVDAHGRPVLGCVARARFAAPHGELPLVADPRDGIHATSDAPQLAGTLEVELAGATSTHAVPALEDPQPIVLDQLGALFVAIGPATLGAARPEIEVRAQGASHGALLVSRRAACADGTIAPFSLHLPPGAWTVTVRTRTEPTQPWATAGTSRVVDIVSGVDAAIDFP